MALDQATADAYNSDPAVKAYLDAMAAASAKSTTTVTPSEQATGSFESAAPLNPADYSAARGTLLSRYGETFGDPTVASGNVGSQVGLPNRVAFGGTQFQPNSAATPSSPVGYTPGLLTSGGGAPAPSAGGGSPAPGSSNVGGGNSPGTPAPSGGGGGGGGGSTPAPGSNNVGYSQAGPPGSPGPGQNAGYSANGAQLLADGTPWLDPATVANAANAQAVTRTVNPNELSGTQLAQLLAEGGPLADRARLEALQGANKAGLLNSSIAVGSAMGAITDRMTPLALQQAQAYGTAASENLAAENTANLQNSQLGTTVNVHNSDSINDRNKTQFTFNASNFLQNDQQAQELLVQMTGHINDMDKQKLLGEQAVDLLRMENENRTSLQTSAAAVATYQAYQSTIAEILKDPKMDANVASKRIEIAKAMFESQMKLIGGMAGVDLTEYLPAGAAPAGTTATPTATTAFPKAGA